MKSVQFFIIAYNTLFFFKKFLKKLMKDSKRKIQLCLDYLVCSENCQRAICRSINTTTVYFLQFLSLKRRENVGVIFKTAGKVGIN